MKKQEQYYLLISKKIVKILSVGVMHYDWKVVAIDSVWGGTLYALTNYIVTKL